MDIERIGQREVEELHEFFQKWFNGEVPDTDASFERFAGVLAPTFHIISPDGTVHDKASTLPVVRGGHGRGGMRIWIRNYEHRLLIGGSVAMATYEEWQETEEGTRGLLSTALLEQADGTPNGLRWLHVHETWLPTPVDELTFEIG
jgi:hypothetical protein